MKKLALLLITFTLWHLPSFADQKLSSLIKKEDGLVFLYDEKSGEAYTSDEERSSEVYPPCSTFNIPNTLIGLDLNILKNKKTKFRWDSKKYPKKKWWPSHWTQDQTLESAFKESVVWYFQMLSQKIEFENFEKYLEKFDYGNVALTGDLDEFWIRGSLRISAREQVAFLQKMYREKLELQKETYETLKNIMVIEKTEDWTLSGKTGTCNTDPKNQLGLLVGYFEKNDHVIYYALQMNGKTYAEISKQKRIALIKKALAAKGYLISF